MKQFLYFEQEGELLPYGIRRPDGVVGYIRPVHGGQFESGQVYETSPACDLGDGASLWRGTDAEGFIFHDEASYTRSELELDIPEAWIRAWLEEEDGNMHLVLVHEMVNHGVHGGTLTDPRTGRLVSYVRNLRFKSIDLETGVLLRDVEEFYNDNDQLITGSRLDEENGLWYSYQFYDMLQEAVSQVYEETVEALEAYLKNQRVNKAR